MTRAHCAIYARILESGSREVRNGMLEPSRVQGVLERSPGVGFNLPGGGPDDPPIARCVTRALDAGATGIVVSREYEELMVPNLKAVGKAIRDATGQPQR
jgi:hypothetical protein